MEDTGFERKGIPAFLRAGDGVYSVYHAMLCYAVGYKVQHAGRGLKWIC
jgi:hypothetical protein